MKRYLCTNCGFWQSHFARPLGCPVCLDFRHTPPDDGWEFLDEAAVAPRFETLWREDEQGIVTFNTAPKLGIGPSGYLIPLEGGNLFFESCGFYDPSALAEIRRRGGVKWLSFSHPHAYGAAWQLQETFDPLLAIQVEDLGWTQTLNVNFPFDAQLEVAPNATLVHTGGHFDGHSVLFLKDIKTLFAGDMLKFHFEGEEYVGLSTHKAFNRRVPMSHGEIRRYQAVVEQLDFERVYTTFERAPDGCREQVLRLFGAQLEGAPFFGPLAV